MNTITAQPNTYVVVGVDEASPPIFVLPVIGWIGASGGSHSDRFNPIAIVNLGLEEAVKNVIVSGDAIAFSRKTQIDAVNRVIAIYIIDIVVGEVPDAKGYVDRFKMLLRNRKVK